MARPVRRLAAAPLLLVLSLALGLSLSACDGSNAFAPTPTPHDSTGGGTGTRDTRAPGVQLVKPDSNANIAVGDSLFVQAHVSDDVALDSVVFRAFEVRGDPNLGNQTFVDRFTPKVVHLRGAGAAVRDTVLRRFLPMLADSSRAQNIRVVVAAFDTAGNTSVATTRVNIGGPRVQILGPAAGTQFFGGTSIPVRVLAVDSTQLVRSIRVIGSGAFAFDTTVTLAAAVPQITDTVVVLVPATQGGSPVSGSETISASVTASSGAQGVAAPVGVTILPSQTDATPPQVSFNAVVGDRLEVDDSFTVTAQATDQTRIDTLGITIFALHPRAGGGFDTVGVITRKVRAASDSVRFSMAQVPLTGLDTVHLRLEVTAWATDPAGNCGAAVTPNTPQAQTCRPGPSGSRISTASGFGYPVLVVRGLTVAPPNQGDVLSDLLADSNRVYLSNFTRNRVDVLPLGGTAYGSPILVGSQPWGLALGRNRDSLYVANSGGTNVSVVPLGTLPLQEAQSKRIFTQNEKLFSVEFDAVSLAVNKVTEFDYSDRPQFIAQASNGLLVYSTKPSPAAADGTVRIFDPRKTRSEIFIGYVDRHTPGRAIVVNADSAFATPFKDVMVCPRRRFGDPTDPGFCITGNPVFVSDSLTRMRSRPGNAAGGKWDTRLDLGARIEEVGLADTTFVAVSGDRNFVAVGEGARVSNARIPLFNAPAGGDSLVLVGDVRDLISNTGERVIGLGLNYDGSLGVARGNQAYYFNNSLRLQGVVTAGSPTGGVAMHPENSGYPGGSFRLSFVSGIDAVAPYVDVIDNFNFFRVKRVYTRDPVVGAMAVAPRAGSDAGTVQLRVYALTSSGILALPVTLTDMTP